MSDGLLEALGPDLMHATMKDVVIERLRATPIAWYERRKLFGRWCMQVECDATAADFDRVGPRPTPGPGRASY